MDWIKQNKLRNGLIVILLALNLLTVSIIWMQTARTGETPTKEPGPRSSESVNLMKKTLDLSEEQTDQLRKLQSTHVEQLKETNDRLAKCKTELAEELFKNIPDTILAAAKAKEIGELQSKVEMLRFQHFHELLALCTPAQKEKFRPIVIEVIGRKPPKEESPGAPPPRGKEDGKIPRDKKNEEKERDVPQNQRDGRPEPPSVEEKTTKYSTQLNLSSEQAQQVRNILQKTKQKGEELRAKDHPDPDVMDAAKEKIRKDEDESIMNILTEGQKKEFAKMLVKRRR
jgi:Spy/CpxP family protein refolding chaperone